MTTKDEIRAAIEAHHQAGYTVCRCGEQFATQDVDVSTWDAAHRDHLTDVIAALLPQETETVEWGAATEGRDPRISHPSRRTAQAVVDRLRRWAQPRLVRRTVTTYAPRRTPWEEA